MPIDLFSWNYEFPRMVLRIHWSWSHLSIFLFCHLLELIRRIYLEKQNVCCQVRINFSHWGLLLVYSTKSIWDPPMCQVFCKVLVIQWWVTTISSLQNSQSFQVSKEDQPKLTKSRRMKKVESAIKYIVYKATEGWSLRGMQCPHCLEEGKGGGNIQMARN